MGLCVEDILVWTEQLHVIRKEQVQVFQRLTQEEALHLVPGPGVNGVTDVVNGRVATAGHLQKRWGLLRCFIDTKTLENTLVIAVT